MDLSLGQFDDDAGAVLEAAPVNSVPLRQAPHRHGEGLAVVLHAQTPAVQLLLPGREGEPSAAALIVCLLFTPNSLRVFLRRKLGVVVGTFQHLLGMTYVHDCGEERGFRVSRHRERCLEMFWASVGMVVASYSF